MFQYEWFCRLIPTQRLPSKVEGLQAASVVFKTGSPLTLRIIPPLPHAFSKFLFFQKNANRSIIEVVKLEELETRLQALVEEHLLRLLPGYTPEEHIARKLALSMQENLRETPQGVQAPNIYILTAHPNTLARWSGESGLLERLAEALYTVGNEAGWSFLSRPALRTVADASLAEGEIRILVSFGEGEAAETLGMTPPTGAPSEEAIPPNAFLILNGVKIIPLTRPVVNIGRRLDNHVVLDDPRVSRSHAQLRAIKGRYVIFDLNSTGGTYVNNQRVNQSVLYPGDVISLAGVALIYGQDLPVSRPTAEPKPETTPSSERPTVILRRDDDSLET